MIQKELQYEMERILPQERILYNEPMDRHCSFRTGGPADALAVVRTETVMLVILLVINPDTGRGPSAAGSTKKII